MTGKDQPRAFTLIELLVVIATIALLMAILLPALSRVRKQARGVGCQAVLKKWSLIFSMYANEHEGRFPGWIESAVPWPQTLKALWPYHRDTNDLFLCPAATKPKSDRVPASNYQVGGTLAPWSLRSTDGRTRIDCSYGVNVWTQYVPGPAGTRDARYWQTIPAQGAAEVPLMLDSFLWWAWRSGANVPAAVEEVWTDSSLPCCLNRHTGFVSAVFADWSIRKVGLKELWSFQWYREYNTRGPWTKAGGLRPEDWPAWMRGFKDY